jgi:hypothetical protein
LEEITRRENLTKSVEQTTGSDERLNSVLSRYTFMRKIALPLVIVSLAAVAFYVAYSYPPRREFFLCQRCGAKLIVQGGQTGGVCQAWIGIEGDPMLYCDKNGHVLVRDQRDVRKVEDYKFQLDSYRDQRSYEAGQKYKAQLEDRLKKKL